MKRSVLLFCLLVTVMCSTVAHGYNVTGAVTGGQPYGFPPHLKYVIAIPMRLDTANFLSNLALVNPFTGQYTFQNLDSGRYVLASFQDMNLNFLPDLDEPRGFWGADSGTFGIPTIMHLVRDTSGINITLSPPNSGGFTGQISYNGQQRGRTYVVAYRDSMFSVPHGFGTSLDTTSDGNGNYTALTDTFGLYWAYAYLDANGNFLYDEDEPFGVYGGINPQSFSIAPLNFPDNIDITLEDPLPPPSAADPVRALPADVRLTSVYPNPFNNTATVVLSVGTPANLNLSLYDLLGREVAVLASGTMAPGEHRIALNGNGLSTGVYFLKLTSPHTSTARAVLLLK